MAVIYGLAINAQNRTVSLVRIKSDDSSFPEAFLPVKTWDNGDVLYVSPGEETFACDHEVFYGAGLIVHGEFEKSPVSGYDELYEKIVFPPVKSKLTFTVKDLLLAVHHGSFRKFVEKDRKLFPDVRTEALICDDMNGFVVAIFWPHESYEGRHVIQIRNMWTGDLIEWEYKMS